jgi:hypothetical protein
MSNKKNALVIAIAALLLSGCLYEVGIPDKPTREINRAFLGTWLFQARKGGQMEISERDKNHYKVILTSPGFKEPFEMTAFHAKVESIDLVAVHAISGSPPWSGRHCFIQYTNDGPDILLLSSLNSDLVSIEIKSQDELIRQIKKASGSTNFFRRDIVPARRAIKSK